MSDALARFEKILAAVNSGVEPYLFVVRPGDRDELPASDGWRGICYHRICATTRAFIEGRAVWRGPAPLILVDLELCESQAEADAVLIHEVDHATRFRPPHREPPRLRGFALERDRAGLSSIVAEAQRATVPLWAFDHGRRFIRAGLHLAWRAREAGYEVRLNDLDLAGERFGLSGPWNYLAALNDELEDLNDMPVSEIEGIPATAAFDDLWERDTAMYLEAAR